MRTRRETVEHPFGTMKMRMGARSQDKLKQVMPGGTDLPGPLLFVITVAIAASQRLPKCNRFIYRDSMGPSHG